MIVFMLVAGCNRNPVPHMNIRDQNIQIVNTYVSEVWNKWNFDIIDSIIHEDFVDPASTTGEKGPDAFKDVMAGLRGIFPDMQMTIDEIVADDSLVAWKWSAVTTYAPQNKKVAIQGIIMDKIDNGRIIQRWGYWDDSPLHE